MIDKIQASMRDAVAVIPDGASVLVGGFGEAGVPYELLHCLAELGRRDLTIIANNAGTHDRGIAALLNRRQVRKIICSHPRPPNSEAFARAFRAGEVELECVPQGTLAERLRAPSRPRCSIMASTWRAPTARSMAPPTAGMASAASVFQLARSPRSETWKAPSTA